MSLTTDQFEDIMDEYEPPKTKRELERGDSETVYSDEDVRVIIPMDEAAACYYGQGTKWCTAATRGDNMFDDYAQRGALYIVIPRDPEYRGEKYQLHFVDQQFMDERDDPVPLIKIFQRFPQLQTFFLSWHPEIKRILDREQQKARGVERTLSPVKKRERDVLGTAGRGLR